MLTGLILKARHVKFLVNDNSTTILAGMGVAGTVTTAYLTGRASFKAAHLIEKEKQLLQPVEKNGTFEGQGIEKDLTRFDKVKLIWRLYIPPAGVCAVTVASIIVGSKISSKKVAALTVASVTSERALQEYKSKVIEKIGHRENQKVRDDIAQDRVNNQPVNSREIIIAGTGEVLCYDMVTGRYFQSSVEEIKRAENKINHELVNFMSASLSSFYDEIGLPATSYTDSVGWNMNNRMEVTFSTVMSSDNRPCIAIDFVSPPIADYNRHYD